jgi:periplasmic copper chaperone A
MKCSDKIVAVSLCLAGTLTAAQAHVVLEKREASPGTSYKGVLSVPHGCAGSATTKVTVTIPEGVIAVKPMPKPGWTVETVKKPYAQTYDFMHGLKLSEGVREISWSGGKLDNDHFDEFIFSGYLAAGLKPGETLYFPAVQECERGAERWVEIAAPGQDAHALKAPAPALRLVAAQGAKAAMFRAGALTVEQPWLRATPKGANVAGGYMKIVNTGKTGDTLIGGTLDGAKRFEVHEMTMQGDVMRMRKLSGGLDIKPGQTVELKPGGFHIMGMDLTGGYTEGQTVKGTLQFKNAGAVAVEYTVQGIGSSGGGHAGHQH